ncbi:hypothetical protein OS493_026025 [Desmophyllum pertusum]|uniref:Uncharacterized protein n=1 Tax=Desmophyllum pertusum TaxID=174260 RepID=A0A9W9YL57_9CNID|nr:hypothetical protein OS493_026025 [Desmophyllum pertusum]
MEEGLLVPLVVGMLLVVISMADPQIQSQFQLRRPFQMNAQTRNLAQSKFIGQKGPQAQLHPFGPRPFQMKAQTRAVLPNRFIGQKGPQAQLHPFGPRPFQMKAQTRTLLPNRFIGQKGPQAQYQLAHQVQLNAQARNFLPNRYSAKKAGHYPPVPPGTGGLLPGYNRNFIPNRFDIPASIINKKPGSSLGCVGVSPCGLAAPYSPPALPIPPPPAPVAYTGFPPAPVPYAPQGYDQAPPMAANGFDMHTINTMAQNTAEAVAAKAKLFGGIHPPKKFVPHLPSLGTPQQGKPPFDPPPPPPEPQAAGFGQLPYQQPLAFGQQGMVPPQPGFGFGPQPAAAGFAQPGAPPMQGNFADPQAFTAPAGALPQDQTPFAPQQPSPLGPQQHDLPQMINNDAPQVPFAPEMNPAPAFNDPGQQMAPDQAGSFDLAKKRMMAALKGKGQMKRFGVPRPVLKSRLVPKPLFKRHT